MNKLTNYINDFGMFYHRHMENNGSYFGVRMFIKLENFYYNDVLRSTNYNVGITLGVFKSLISTRAKIEFTLYIKDILRLVDKIYKFLTNDEKVFKFSKKSYYYTDDNDRLDVMNYFIIKKRQEADDIDNQRYTVGFATFINDTDQLIAKESLVIDYYDLIELYNVLKNISQSGYYSIVNIAISNFINNLEHIKNDNNITGTPMRNNAEHIPEDDPLFSEYTEIVNQTNGILPENIIKKFQQKINNDKDNGKIVDKDIEIQNSNDDINTDTQELNVDLNTSVDLTTNNNKPLIQQQKQVDQIQSVDDNVIHDFRNMLSDSEIDQQDTSENKNEVTNSVDNNINENESDNKLLNDEKFQQICDYMNIKYTDGYFDYSQFNYEAFKQIIIQKFDHLRDYGITPGLFNEYFHIIFNNIDITKYKDLFLERYKEAYLMLLSMNKIKMGQGDYILYKDSLQEDYMLERVHSFFLDIQKE